MSDRTPARFGTGQHQKVRPATQARAYARLVADEHPKKKWRVNFGLPDDRKSSWVYLTVLCFIALIFVSLLDAPASDTKVQAITVLGFALISTGVCSYWAYSLRRALVSVEQYIKGTTASRTLIWFWAVFGSISAFAPKLGISGQAFLPLWDSALGAFAGMGAVLLTAGPAYKEYREAIATIQPTPEPEADRAQPPTVPTTQRVKHRTGSSVLLIASLAAAWVIGRKSLHGPADAGRQSAAGLWARSCVIRPIIIHFKSGTYLVPG